MQYAEEQLVRIGFGHRRTEPACWRAVRLDRAAAAVQGANGPEPACSRDLLRWRDLLSRSPVPPGYRISRA